MLLASVSAERATGVFIIHKSDEECSHLWTAIWHINFQFAAPQFRVTVYIQQPVLEAYALIVSWCSDIPLGKQASSLHQSNSSIKTHV